MKQKPTDYRNRIKALEYVDAADLTAHPGNWRDHPKAQADALKGVLAEVGIAGALLAYRSERQGGALVVIDGHLRKDAAPQQWPVLILDVDDAEADYILSTHDPLAAMATADAGALDALLSSVQSGEAAVQAMLAELAEGAGLYAPRDDSDAEPQIDRAEELRQEWGVESGQLWRLPSRTPGQEHRLICGDCTDAAVVERVMGGERAALVLTDPPYNIGLKYTDYKDDKTPNEFRAQVGQWSETIRGMALAAIVTPGRQNIALWLNINGGQTGAWIKNNAHGGASIAHFAKWEPILFIGKHMRERDSDVFEHHVDNGFLNDGSATGHLCPKPLRLWDDLLGHYSKTGDVVAEPFLGSGTTIIAAENLSRQCRAVEISPGYVAVALQRYCDAFGITPELID